MLGHVLQFLSHGDFLEHGGCRRGEELGGLSGDRAVELVAFGVDVEDADGAISDDQRSGHGGA